MIVASLIGSNSMNQSKWMLAAGAAGLLTAVIAAVVFFAIGDERDVAEPPVANSTVQRPRDDFPITANDLEAMTLDETAIESVSARITDELIRAAFDGPINQSPLRTDRARRLGAVTGWTTPFGLEAFRADPPPGHAGLYGMITTVHLFKTDVLALEEFIELVTAGVEPIDRIGTSASGTWDDAGFFQSRVQREGYSEFSSVAMIRVGSVIGFVALVSNVDEVLREEATALARVLADRIRAVLTDLGAFEGQTITTSTRAAHAARVALPLLAEREANAAPVYPPRSIHTRWRSAAAGRVRWRR